MNTNNSKVPIDLHNVTILGEPVDNIIFFASIILPFINEISIILTKSGMSMFHNLYKICARDDVLLSLSETCKNNNIHCSHSETIRRIFIDAVAYLGIILNIGRNTIKHGYVIGVVNGFILIICSIVFPNLYLSKIIHVLTHFLNVNKPIIRIIIGLICLIILVIFTYILQNKSSKIFKKYKIDVKREHKVHNKIEQEIIHYLE